MSDRPNFKVLEFPKPAPEGSGEPPPTMADQFRKVADLLENDDCKDLNALRAAVIMLHHSTGSVSSIVIGRLPRREVLGMLSDLEFDLHVEARTQH